MAVSKIRKISSSTLLIIAIIAVVVFAMFLFGGVIDPTAARPEPRYTDLLLYLCYGTLIAAVVVLLAFAVMSFVQKLRTDAKSALSGLIAIVALIAMFGITYAIGNTDPLKLSVDFQQYNTDYYLKLADMWLYSTYIVFGITILTMIWGAVRTSLKGKK